MADNTRKYTCGQFGYLTNVSELEDAFVCIQICDKKDRLKCVRYDITSLSPNQLSEEIWVSIEEFIPIQGTYAGKDFFAADSIHMQLLNWKICREDFLAKKIQSMTDNEHKYNDKCAFSSEDDRNHRMNPYYSTSDVKTDLDSDNINNSDTLSLLREGFAKDKHLNYTTKGEIFVANDLNKSSEPVCIKKTRIYLDSEFLKNAQLISACAYVGHFQTEQHFYFVTMNDFGASLMQFVEQCSKYIKRSKALRLRDYRKKMREMLWGLVLTVYNLHKQNVFGLDLCLENIFLRHSDFIENGDGSVMINPAIEFKLIDFGFPELEGMGTKSIKAAQDTYYLGEICYFCLVFQVLTEEAATHDLERYLAMYGLKRLLGPRSLLLLVDLLNTNEEKRLKKIEQVYGHKYFRVFRGTE